MFFYTPSTLPLLHCIFPSPLCSFLNFPGVVVWVWMWKKMSIVAGRHNCSVIECSGPCLSSLSALLFHNMQPCEGDYLDDLWWDETHSQCHTSVMGLRGIWLYHQKKKKSNCFTWDDTRKCADSVPPRHIWETVCSGLTEQSGKSLSTHDEGRDLWNKCWLGSFQSAVSFLQLGLQNRLWGQDIFALNFRSLAPNSKAF